MSSESNVSVLRGLGEGHGLKLHSYSRKSADGVLHDCPSLVEHPLHLYTLPYSELIDALADTLFPPNHIELEASRAHELRASDARVDRYIHFRAAWQPSFGARLQLALRDLTQASLNRFERRHFVVLTQAQRDEITAALQAGKIPLTQWTTLRPQAEAFGTIYDAICCGLMAEPGYGGNANGLGWFYTRFMTLEA